MEYEGYVDIHSHIIPGVDDGSQSFEESMEMLNIAYDQGVRVMYATSHFGSGKEKYDKELLLERFEKLKEMALGVGDDGIELLLGNEVYYRPGTVELLDKKEIFTMGGSRYVLVEFAYGISYNELYRSLQKLINAGYVPILAHIERYYCLYRKFSEIASLREMGIGLQINTDSVMAKFSSEASFCRKLIRNGYIHFLASDCHRVGWRPPVMKDGYSVLEKKTPPEYLDRLMRVNPDILRKNQFL